LWAVGDSKTVNGTWGTTAAFWITDHRIRDASFDNGGLNGQSVTGWRTIIDTTLAGISKNYDDVFIDLGVNDSTPGDATWQSNYAYIVDAIHTKWPSAKIIISYPWKRSWGASTAACHTAIDAMLSTRGPWAVAGDDEAVWLEGGDNGVTMTSDGVHYSTAGDNKKATLVEIELP